MYDWTDKSFSFIQYRMLKVFVRNGMLVDEVHEIISFTQNKWWER